MPAGGPRHEVGNVLRRNQVEKLGRTGQADFIDIQQQLAGQAQTFIDIITLVQMRIVDQPLPAHRGARLFKIHPHDDDEIVRQFVGQWL
jgi:hypothetical protein